MEDKETEEARGGLMGLEVGAGSRSRSKRRSRRPTPWRGGGE